VAIQHVATNKFVNEDDTIAQRLGRYEDRLDYWVEDAYRKYSEGKHFRRLDVVEKAEFLFDIIEGEVEPLDQLEFEDHDYSLERVTEFVEIGYMPLKLGSEYDFSEGQTVQRDGNLMLGAPERANSLEEEYNLENTPNIVKDVDVLEPDRT
jgi:hypothetical protein